MDIPLSDHQIRESLTALKVPVIDYADIVSYSSLTHLFEDRDIIVIFNRNSQHEIGHWQVMIKRLDNPAVFEFYCSLGFDPDEFQKKFSEDETYIRNLVSSQEELNFISNQYQSKKSQLCGKYVIHRILCCKLDTEKFHDLMGKLKNIYGNWDDFMLKTIALLND